MFDALTGAGRGAAEIARLSWVMTGAAAAIWILMTGLALHAVRHRGTRWSDRAGLRLILFGGCVIPTIVLGALLAYGMPVLARQRAALGPAAVRVTVIGEQWWWRVRYDGADGTVVELANEVRLPRGRTTAVSLASGNVIHSFWIPALAGKVDLIPGRITELRLEPLVAGIYRGMCAEFCGASHARMTFVAEVMEPEAFDRWLASQQQAAVPDREGTGAFLANGCGACHAVRGTAAVATIGPDLTHVGSRHQIAGGTVPNDAAAIAQWLSRPDKFKPGALMPPFEALPADQRQRLAEYLRSLQ